ncbi:hypothetical protein D3C81_340710 [compost metagenome]
MNNVTMKRAVIDATGIVAGFSTGHSDGPSVPEDVPVAVGWRWDIAEGFLPPAAPVPDSIEKVAARRYAEIDSACQQAITGGFESDALGAGHRYSSELDDQLNLTGAILRGVDMPYACRDAAGFKAFRSHTTVQLRQVGDDFTVFKLQLLQKANDLKQRLELAVADDDLAAVEAVTWTAGP